MHSWDAAEEESQEHDAEHPSHGTNDVESKESAIRHGGGSCGERKVSAHERNEASQDQGRGPVLGEKFLRLVEAIGLENPSAWAEQRSSKPKAQVIPSLIAEKRRHDRNEEQLPEGERKLFAKQGRGDEERISGEEGKKDTGFDEDDHADAEQQPGAESVEQHCWIRHEVQGIHSPRIVRP